MATVRRSKAIEVRRAIHVFQPPQTLGEVYNAVIEYGIEHTHENSDLLVRVTPLTSRLLLHYRARKIARECTRLDRPGEKWYVVPFAYAPAWREGV